MATEIQYYRDFEASEYGQELVQKTRFDTFKPDFVSTELWGDLLGDDVNNLYHMPHTHEIATTFALYGGLGELATHRLQHTAMTHDWGEAKIGDIPLPDKTAADESEEEIAYREIANELLGGVQGKYLANSVWSILKHEDVVLGDQFKAIEYIGYCTTAMRAADVAEKVVYGLQTVDISRNEKDRLVSGLLGLHKAVSVNNYPVLARYVQKYPHIQDVLKEYRG